MEIFAIFVLLPAGGVVVCSITANSVPEQKPEGISSYWALLSTAEVSSVSWLGVWFLHTAFKYFSALDPGWTDEMMCSGSLPLSQDQPHTLAHTSATRLFFLLPHQLDEEYFWLAEVKSSFLSCLLPMTRETGIDYDTNVSSKNRFSSCRWSKYWTWSVNVFLYIWVIFLIQDMSNAIIIFKLLNSSELRGSAGAGHMHFLIVQAIMLELSEMVQLFLPFFFYCFCCVFFINFNCFFFRLYEKWCG